MSAALAGIVLPDADALRAALRAASRGFVGGDASAEVLRRELTRAEWPGGPMGANLRTHRWAWGGIGVYGFGRDAAAQGSVMRPLPEAARLDWQRAVDRMDEAMPSLPEPRAMPAAPTASALLTRALDTARAAAPDARGVTATLELTVRITEVQPWRADDFQGPRMVRADRYAALIVTVGLDGGGRGRAREVSRDPWPPSPEHAAFEAVRRACHAAESRGLAPGRTTAVLRPEVTAMWAHEVFGHRLEADHPAALRVGEAAPAGITVQHEAEEPDDEAAPTHRVTLLEDGRVRGALATARDVEASPGAGLVRSAYRQDVRHRPLARQRTLRLTADAPDAALATPSGGLSRGLLVTHAAHALIAGDRVTLEGAAGWHVESGRRNTPFAGAALHFSADAPVEALGADAPETPVPGICVKAGQRVGVFTSAPSVRVMANVAPYAPRPVRPRGSGR